MLSSANHIEDSGMNTVWRIALVLILLSCLACSCSQSTKYENIGLTPWANEEAELMALCLSGELVAPACLYRQVLNDLAAIRFVFSDDFKPINHITFMPPWIVSCLIIGFDDNTAQKVANGEYHAWDELNNKYQVSIDKNNTYRSEWLCCPVFQRQVTSSPPGRTVRNSSGCNLC
jgi:hypothetical protein